MEETVVVIVISALLQLPPILVPALSNYAWASCGGIQLHQAVGGNENNALRLGDKADVLVNAFGSPQFRSWRSVVIRQNSVSQRRSAGSSTRSSIIRRLTRIRLWINNGVGKTLGDTTVNLTTGILTTFKVHDQNHDHYWSFAYAGTPLGNEFVNMDWGTPISEAERECTTDSLYAHFKNLQQIGCTNCGRVNYDSLQQYVNATTDYSFCRISTTEYWVKQVC